MQAGPANHILTVPPHALAVLQIVAPEAEIVTFAVHPCAQRQGQGRALLRKVIATARQQGVAKIFLEVASDNVGAQTLYANGGFERTGLRKGYYRNREGTRQDAVLMALILDARESGNPPNS